MKQVKYIILCLCLLIVSGVQAQIPQGKTNATIISDALDKLPAQTQVEYNQIISDLVSTGEEGLLDLIGRMIPPGNISNETYEFAITGWTHFVANDDQKRSEATKAFEKALAKPIDREIKAYLVRHLRTIGSDDNVEVLAGFLNDEYLSDPAAQALVSIGTNKSHTALLDALKSASSDIVKLNLTNALGHTDFYSAEPTLLSLLENNNDESMEKVLLNALANVGSKASIKPLRKAAEEVNYSYSNNSAVGSYITLLEKLKKSDAKIVKKEANRLLSNAEKQGKHDLKIAAVKILLEQTSVKPDKILKNAIKDGNANYLTNILEVYPFRNDMKSVNLIKKEIASNRSPEVLTPLIYWLGENKSDNVASLLSRHISSPNKMVQKATTLSLVKIGGEESLLALTGLLKSNDEASIELAKNALMSYDGNISNTLALVFNESADIGKIAVLEIIANRKDESQYNLVYNQMLTDNKEVKLVAANSLKDVSTDKNLSDLFTLLEQSDNEYVTSIQQAINNSLTYLPLDERTDLVAEKMNKSAKKHLYYSALASIGSSDAIKKLYAIFNSEKGASKEAAFDALTNINSFHVIYPILEIARSSNDKKELEKVTDALINVIGKSSETGQVKYLYLREAMQFAQTDLQKNNILRQIGNTAQYQAMLYAVPFMDNPAYSESAALAVMNIGISNSSFAGDATTAALNKAAETLNNPDADYQRQSITKFLSENPNEGGFVSLFNGYNLDGWKGLVANPIKRSKMSERELAAAQVKADSQMNLDWKVEGGMIVFDGQGYDNLCTVKQYGDFEMLIDWKLYPGPEPDAGVYLRGTPQVQIWDTARVNVGAQVGSGGLYNNQKSSSKPLAVADQKVGEWNTFRIVMIGEQVSVWLNGELVTDNVILENFWDRSQPIFPIEQIELQAHGSKVAYRDIYIKELH